MKLKDLKPGGLYAYQRSDNYEIQPMMFLSADLYRERSSNVRSGPYFCPVPKPYAKWDKPKAGTWGSGSTGYAACFIGHGYHHGEFTEHEIQLLMTASLDEFTKLGHMNPPARPVDCRFPGCGLELEETETRGAYKHDEDAGQDHQPVLPPDMYAIAFANERHQLIRYDVLTSLGKVRGDYRTVTAEAELARQARMRQQEEARQYKAGLDDRAKAATGQLNRYGIDGIGQHPYRSGEVHITLEGAEQLARVVEWASSRGMRHMSQYGPAS